MCGFVVSVTHNSTQDYEHRFGQATALQVHRGPDQNAVMRFGDTWFGFNRLAIIDLSAAAAQPIQHGPIVLVMNGEIYNYIELRAELAAQGATFRSKSDSEVFAAALHTWGLEEACQRARGMWAAVALDKRTNALLVSRDRLGIKPLWFSQSDSELVLASEIKSILQLAPQCAQPNPVVLSRYLADGLLDTTDDTFFSGVYRFPAGHCATVESGRVLSPKPFWSLRLAPKHEAPAIGPVLEEALQQHLRSDVPVGLALSGGLDSTTLAYFARQTTGLKCYSVRHPRTAREDERIDATVSEWGLQHKYLSSGEVEAPAVIDQVLKVLDQPFKATQTLYQYSIRKAAAEDGAKVLLTGDGADEVFGGYVRCVPPYLTAMAGGLRCRRLWQSARELAHFAGTPPLRLVWQAVRMATRLRLGPLGAPERPHEGYLSQSLRSACGPPTPPPRASLESLKGYLATRLQQTPIPYWLRVEDGISMAVSQETRVPFLDHVLIETVLSHPEASFFAGGKNKALLRTAMTGRLPDHIEQPFEKFMRPGSTPRLVFDILPDEVAAVLDGAARKTDWFTAEVGADRFRQDQKDRQHAHFWFRAYLALRWRAVCLQVGSAAAIGNTSLSVVKTPSDTESEPCTCPD